GRVGALPALAHTERGAVAADGDAEQAAAAVARHDDRRQVLQVARDAGLDPRPPQPLAERPRVFAVPRAPDALDPEGDRPAARDRLAGDGGDGLQPAPAVRPEAEVVGTAPRRAVEVDPPGARGLREVLRRPQDADRPDVARTARGDAGQD